jgi:NitT/TauT family transport system substrate-binding protein
MKAKFPKYPEIVPEKRTSTMAKDRNPRTRQVRFRNAIGAPIAVSAMLAAALTACSSSGGGGSSDETGASGPSSAKLTNVSVSISQPGSAVNAGLIVGINKKIFAQCGLTVKLAGAGGGGGDTTHVITSGAATFAMPALASPMIAYLQHQDVTVIGGEAQGTNGMSYLVKPNSPLKTIRQLVGKKVGVSNPSSSSQTNLVAVLKAVGVDPGKVKSVSVGAVTSGVTALASGAVDATWANYPDSIDLVDRGKARMLINVSDYVKHDQYGVILAKKSWVEKNSDTASKFVTCLDRSYQWMHAHVAEAGAIFAKVADIDTKLAVKTLKLEAKSGNYTTDLTVPGIQYVLDTVKAAGQVPSSTSLSDIKGLFTLPKGAPVTFTGGSL